MTKKTMLLGAFCAVAFAALAEREYIWPEGKMPDAQDHQIAAMTNEKEKGKFPYLDWCPAPEKPNGCCMILISGGGYQCCCDVGLVQMWERKFTDTGFQCVNFVYRTPRPQGLPIYKTAWEDGQRAVRLVRSQAAKRGYDAEKIGTISMSAGSHLAALLATSALTPAYEKVDAVDDIPCHLNWAITGAIAYAMTDGIGVPNTRNGQSVDAKLDDCFKFDAKTAPMCMFHGSADVYSPTASTFIYRELRKQGQTEHLGVDCVKNAYIESRKDRNEADENGKNAENHKDFVAQKLVLFLFHAAHLTVSAACAGRCSCSSGPPAG